MCRAIDQAAGAEQPPELLHGACEIDKDVQEMWRAALRLSTVGLEMGVSVAIGCGAGWWLDRQFGTEPYLMLTMLLMGVAAAFLTLFRAARQAKRSEENDT